MVPLKVILTYGLVMFLCGSLSGWGARSVHESDPVRKYDNLQGCEENASNIHRVLFKVEDTLVYCEADRDTAKEKVKILEAQGCVVPEQDTQE